MSSLCECAFMYLKKHAVAEMGFSKIESQHKSQR